MKEIEPNQSLRADNGSRIDIKPRSNFRKLGLGIILPLSSLTLLVSACSGEKDESKPTSTTPQTYTYQPTTEKAADDLKNLFDCAVQGDIGCQNDFIGFRTEAVDIILSEILNENMEHEYIPGSFVPLTNVLNVSTDMLLRINGGEPDAVESAVSKVVNVLECSTSSPCSVDINGKELTLKSSDIEKPIGQNALNFIKSIVYDYPPGVGINLVSPHMERLNVIAQWLEENGNDSNNYTTLSLQFREITSYLEEQMQFKEN